MRIVDESREAKCLGPEPIVFNYSSKDPEISRLMTQFNQLQEGRAVVNRTGDRLFNLKRQLQLAKELYDYVMVESFFTEGQVSVAEEKNEFRRQCSIKFIDMVGDLRAYYECLRVSTLKFSKSIEAYLVYLDENAMAKLKAVPKNAPKVTSLCNAPDAQAWIHLRSATIATAVIGGVVCGGGVEQLYEHIAQAPDVIGDFASSAAGTAVGVLTGAVCGHKFFQPSTPAHNAAEADAEYDVELCLPTL